MSQERYHGENLKVKGRGRGRGEGGKVGRRGCNTGYGPGRCGILVESGEVHDRVIHQGKGGG